MFGCVNLSQVVQELRNVGMQEYPEHSKKLLSPTPIIYVDDATCLDVCLFIGNPNRLRTD